MKQKFLKKFIGIILAGVLCSFLFMPNYASAQACPDAATYQKRKVKSYLSESLGGGCEIFRIVRCSKVPAQADLKCTVRLSKKAGFQQCLGQAPAGGGERPVKFATTVHKCTKGGRDLSHQDETSCKNGGGDWLPRKGYVFAAVECPTNETGQQIDSSCGQNNPDKGVIKWTFVVEDNNAATAGEELQTLKNALSPQHSAQRWFVSQVWEIGSQGQEMPCLTGDFNVNKNGTIGTPLDGDLDSLAISELNNTCRSINENSLLGGNAHPLIRCNRVQVILSESGTGLLSEFIGALYRWSAGIVGIIAVLVMVVSGIQISMAGGDSAKVDSAKTRILQSIAGLVILFLAGLILYTINPNFFTAG